MRCCVLKTFMPGRPLMLYPWHFWVLLLSNHIARGKSWL